MKSCFKKANTQFFNGVKLFFNGIVNGIKSIKLDMIFKTIKNILFICLLVVLFFAPLVGCGYLVDINSTTLVGGFIVTGGFFVGTLLCIYAVMVYDNCNSDDKNVTDLENKS